MMSLFLRRLIVPVMMAAAVVPAASPVAAKPKPVTAYIKPGGTYEAFKAMADACHIAAKAARDKVASVPYQPGAANAMAAGIEEGMARGKAYNEAYEACFADGGYVLETLSEEDAKAFNATKKADREAWIKAYYERRAAESADPEVLAN